MNKRKRRKNKSPLRFLLPCAALVLAAAIGHQAFLASRTGWVERDGQFYYYNEDHQRHTGWLQLEDGTYYLNEDGTRHTGWLEENGSRRYFTQDGLMMENGWIGEGIDRRLIVNGVMVTGLQISEEKCCYFDEDGHLVTGWVDLEDGRRYFDPAEGWALSGIQTIDGVTYGFTAGGLLASGWLEVDGVTYRIAQDGTPLPGGWQEIEETTYYLSDDGSLYQGWLEDGGHTYYMVDGLYTTGILPLEGRNYFFDSRGWNILMVNPWNTVPDSYEEVEVTSVGGDHYIASHAAVDFSHMIYALQQLEMGPIITSSYRTGTRQQEIFDERMAGYMAQGMSEEDAYAKTATSVAIPGTSEHQLGLAMDMTDAQYNKLDAGQMETPTQLWLIENSWKYGFILRYPDGKSEITGIIYEPWHYRYVGKELAAEIHESGLTLEEYLASLS